jgi:hypothetical protein
VTLSLDFCGCPLQHDLVFVYRAKDKVLFKQATHESASAVAKVCANKCQDCLECAQHANNQRHLDHAVIIPLGHLLLHDLGRELVHLVSE